MNRKALGDALESVPDAAIVIDPARGLLLAASRLARELLGIGELVLEAPLVLDGSMPAIIALREFVQRANPDDARVLPLVFWTPRGAQRLTCVIHRPLRASVDGTLLLKLAVPEPGGMRVGEISNSATSALPVHLPNGAVHTSAPPELSATDAATLKEIARRLRETDRAVERGEQKNAGAGIAAPMTTSDATRPNGSANLSHLAHELRTPLAAIAALAEVMVDGRFGPLANERYQDYAKSIRDQARHSLGVVEKMLTGDSLATGLPEMAATEISLNAIASETVAGFAGLADESGATISLEVGPRMMPILADATSIRQILINLISNSLRHAGKRCQVGVRTGRGLGGDVWIEVSDNGPGFPPDVADRLAAARFLPLPASASGRRGIGLPLVIALAEANGGVVSFSRRLPRGASVRVSFMAMPSAQQ